jgi:hypothetical protein
MTAAGAVALPAAISCTTTIAAVGIVAGRTLS